MNKTHLGYTMEIYLDNIDENLIQEIKNIIKNKYKMKIIENIEVENVIFNYNQKLIIENAKLKSIANKNIEDKDRLLNEKYKCD